MGMEWPTELDIRVSFCHKVAVHSWRYQLHYLFLSRSLLFGSTIGRSCLFSLCSHISLRIIDQILTLLSSPLAFGQITSLDNNKYPFTFSKCFNKLNFKWETVTTMLVCCWDPASTVSHIDKSSASCTCWATYYTDKLTGDAWIVLP